MSDLVNIGWNLDTSKIATGFRDLDGLQRKSETVEKRVNKSVNSLNAGFLSLSNSIGLVTAAITTFAAASGVGAAISANTEFAKSVSSLSAITGAVGKDLEFYKQQAAEIGATTTLSASQAVQAFKLIASAKPDLLANAEALAQVTKEAVLLTEASGGTLGLVDAASALGRSLNQFGLDASEANRVVNLLAESSRAGTADVQSVSESMKNVGATARGMNVSIVETVAGIQALAKAGLEGAEAGTALRQVLSRLEKTGDAELRPSIVGLDQAIQNLSKRNLDSIAIMDLFGQEASTAANAILAQADTLTHLTNTLDGTNTALMQSQTNVDNLAGDLLSLDSVVESLRIAFGERLDPTLRSSVQMITEILRSSEALADALKAVGVVAGAALAPSLVKATGSMLAAGKAALLAGTEVTVMSSGLRLATGQSIALTVANNALTLSLRALMGPWGIAIAAISVGAAVFMSSKQRSDELAASLNEQQEAMSLLTKDFKKLNDEGRASAIEQINQSVSQTLDTITSLSNQIQAAEKNLSLLDSGSRASERSRIKQMTDDLELARQKLVQLRSEAAAAFDSTLPKNWIDPLESDQQSLAEYNKQLAELQLLAQQVGKTQEQIFVEGEIARSKERKDTAEQTAEIEKQARALVQLKAEQQSKDYLEQLKQENETIGKTAGEIAYLTAMRQSNNKELAREIQLQVETNEAQRKFAQNAEDFKKWTESVTKTQTELQRLTQELNKVNQAVAMGKLSADDAGVVEYVKNLNKQIAELTAKPFDEIGNAAKGTLQSLTQLYAQGSKESQQLVKAINAITAAMAIQQAVASATTGNIVGAISATAGLLASFGSSSFKDLSIDMQANQGLNIWGEKSDSIARSNDIIADATNKLVGINTGMLKALRGLTAAMSGAAGLISRDAVTPNIDIGSLPIINNVISDTLLGNIAFGFMDKLSFGIFGKIGGWLGGRSSVTNEGIRIIGGSINDLIEDVTVQAFQSVSYKKWRWGSTKNKTEYANISDQVGAQVSLVLESMADSVAEAAKVLGFSTQEIESRINAFNIATTTISTKGLSKEQQQKEIEAVFSKIFDDLAVSVIDFLPDMQKAGEGVGETLTRIATQVAIADEMVTRFGVTFGDKMADPEAYAKAADNLAALVGGVEELASKTAGFTDAFATDAQKFDIYQRAMNNALADVGLILPSSASGFYDLMQSIDGSTEAGQEQIATLLNITDTAKGYYDLLERSTKRYQNAIDSIWGVNYAVEQMSLDAALAAARIGDLSLADDLDLNALNPKASDFASEFEYNLARAETAAKLEELQAITAGQISIEEKQLDVLKEIRDQQAGSGATVNQDSSNVENEIKMLRADMITQQKQTNLLLEQMVYQA